MKAVEIIDLLDQWALPELIEEWDNSGLQIGDPEKEIQRILVTLDIDAEVVETAINKGVQMIISHHPMIFKPLSSVTRLSYKGRLVYDLIREDIVVYTAHTNLDLAKNGVNDALSNILELKDAQILKNIFQGDHFSEEKGYGYGRIGEIDTMPLREYLDFVKRQLKIEELVVYGSLDRVIGKVAICGGSGSPFIYDAYKKGGDIYITGDIKYHDAQFGNELGLTIVDAGHYHTEKVILPIIKEYLAERLSDKISIHIHKGSSPSHVIY